MKRIVQQFLGASAWMAVAIAAVGVSLAQQPTAPETSKSPCLHGKCQTQAAIHGKVRDLTQDDVILELSVEGRSQGCPILNKIPYVSRLFRNVGKASEKIVLQIPRAMAKSLAGVDSTPSPEETAKPEHIELEWSPPGLVMEVEDDIRFFTPGPQFGLRQAAAILPLPKNNASAQPQPVATAPACCETDCCKCEEGKCCAQRSRSERVCCDEACLAVGAPAKCSCEGCADGNCRPQATGAAPKHQVTKDSTIKACPDGVCNLVIAPGQRCACSDCPVLPRQPSAYRPGPPVLQQPPVPVVVHPPGFPQELLNLATENARLKAENEAARRMHEFKEQCLKELFEAQRINAELQARLESSQQRQELMESVMELVAENAKLSTVAELTQEHVEMMVRMSQLEAQIPATQISSLKDVQQENALLRAKIEELEKRIAEKPPLDAPRLH